MAFFIPRLRTGDGSKLFVIWPKHARAHPELDYFGAQFCAWMSFGKAQKMLERMFPVNVGISGVSLHRSLGKVAGVPERQIDADKPADTMILPIDTTFVRGNSKGAQRKMEVMVGAVEPDRGDVTYFSAPASMAEACVEIGKSHMKSAGWTPSTKLVALTDGGRNVQSFAARMGAIHRPITDWFHISMRIQHVEACAGAFPAVLSQTLVGMLHLHEV